MKRMFLATEKVQNSLNWQEVDIFEGKRAAHCRRQIDESSPILGHPPNIFLTCGKQFQSSPIGRVNHGAGNTASLYDHPN